MTELLICYVQVDSDMSVTGFYEKPPRGVLQTLSIDTTMYGKHTPHRT